MKTIVVSLCLLYVLSIGCKKEKIKMIGYTVTVNVPDGVTYTLYKTGNTAEFFRIHSGKTNASASTILSAAEGTNLTVKVTTTEPNDSEIELIITKASPKTVIYHQKAKDTIAHNFIAE